MNGRDDADLHSALASPMRQLLLAALDASIDPRTAQDLAARVDLHVTTVRFHLDQLIQAGLVARQTDRSPRRGRPSVLYRAVGPNAPLASEQMIDALASALAAGRASKDDVIAAGRGWADSLAPNATDAGPAIVESFTTLGFNPERDGQTIRLRSCPFREAARRNTGVVCLVHLGLARGLAERTGDVHVDLRPFVEPELCVITLGHAGVETAASVA
jgi:predicted ArsR family transcriptional regulator